MKAKQVRYDGEGNVTKVTEHPAWFAYAEKPLPYFLVVLSNPEDNSKTTQIELDPNELLKELLGKYTMKLIGATKEKVELMAKLAVEAEDETKLAETLTVTLMKVKF